jgi:hypothetical protein
MEALAYWPIGQLPHFLINNVEFKQHIERY